MKVSLDFDGTLSRHTVQEYAKELLLKNVDVWVCTSRAKNPKIKKGGIILNPNEDLYKVTDFLGIHRDKIIFTESKLKVDTWEFQKESFIFHLDDDSVEIKEMINESMDYPNFITTPILFDKNFKQKCESILKLYESRTKRSK